MSTRRIEQEATVEGDELVITRGTSQTRVDLRSLVAWIAEHRADLLEPYMPQDVEDE